MTTFVDFCRLHGVLIDYTPQIGVWKRFKTEDKPTHRNGAVKFMGDHGFVQNHATMNEVAVWRSEGETPQAIEQMQKVAKKAADDISKGQQKAAERAAWVLQQTKVTRHAYTASKGFPDEQVHVWESDKGALMAVPMRVGLNLVGLQLIDEQGTKKFLFGQRCSLAQYVFNAGNGPDIVCEGYATALSVRLAMARLKRPYTLHVCFSAGNMKKVAQGLQSGFVIADNDASGTGERIAKEIGWPYWMSDSVGEDANDYHQRKGIFALSQGLQKLFLEARRR